SHPAKLDRRAVEEIFVGKADFLNPNIRRPRRLGERGDRFLGRWVGGCHNKSLADWRKLAPHKRCHSATVRTAGQRELPGNFSPRRYPGTNILLTSRRRTISYLELRSCPHHP